MANEQQKTPKITLLGAGPGDPGLLTRKGWNTLLTADIVLTDALGTEAILQELPAHIPVQYVGKRNGKHSCSQAEINQIMVESAFQYGHVVRLKGGDPFVFGRGYEELLAAWEHNIPTEVIPGISSAIGVPTYHGIPVTSRGYSESVWILTATTANHELSQDITFAAQSKATIVILMGTQKLEKIVAALLPWRPADTPIAILQKGTLPDAKVEKGTLETILQQLEGKTIESPGLIVVGATVNVSSFHSFGV